MSKSSFGISASFKGLALAVLIGATIVYIANFRPTDAGSWFGKMIAPARAAYPFELTDQNGNRFRLADQRGDVILLNFGFTNCPNICPTSLANLAAVCRQLPDPIRQRVRVVFVSVDERDDIAALKKYIPLFDEKFTGLTGNKETIGTVARAYGAFYRKAESPTKDEEDYLIDHSTNTTLIDPEGNLRLVYSIDQLAKSAEMAGDILQIFGLPRPVASPGEAQP